MIGVGIGLTVQRRRATAVAWSPALEGGKLLWFRADTSVQLAGGKAVQWNDQSGLGNHAAVLGTSGTQPIQTTWSAGLGAAALYFDGNDRMATTGNVLPTADGAGFTTFFVGSFDDTIGRCALLTNGTTGGIALSQNLAGDGLLERWKLGVAFDADGAARSTPLNVVMVDQVGAAPGSTMHVNGALVTTSSPDGGVITPGGRLFLGASATSNYFKGFIAEILIVSGRASLATIALWNAYTLNRYGV